MMENGAALSVSLSLALPPSVASWPGQALHEWQQGKHPRTCCEETEMLALGEVGIKAASAVVISGRIDAFFAAKKRHLVQMSATPRPCPPSRREKA